jgi:hypothetical protein
MTREECVESSGDEELLFADGFDDAIIGTASRGGETFVVYDEWLCLETLMARDGMDLDEAREFFDFNVAGSWLGPKTPLFVNTRL